MWKGREDEDKEGGVVLLYEFSSLDFGIIPPMGNLCTRVLRKSGHLALGGGTVYASVAIGLGHERSHPLRRSVIFIDLQASGGV